MCSDTAEPLPSPQRLSVSLTRELDGQACELAWENQRAQLTPVADGTIESPTSLMTSLGSETHFALLGGRLRRQLEIGAHTYRVARGQVDRALLIIALCRLDAPYPPEWDETPFIRNPGTVARAVITERLPAEGIVLGCLPTKKHIGKRSTVLGSFHAPAWFVVTETEAFLLATSVAGDVEIQAVRVGSVRVANGRVSLDGEPLTSKERKQFVALAGLVELEGSERLLAAARLHYDEATAAARERASRFLAQAAARGHHGASILRAWLGGPEAPLDPALADVDLVKLQHDFALNDEQARQFLARLPRTDAWATAALALAQALHDSRVQGEPEPSVRVEAGLDLAECLLSYRRGETAATLLSTLQSLLPPPALTDVELPTGLRRSAWSRARHRIAELTLSTGLGTNDAGRALCTNVAEQTLQTAPLDFELIDNGLAFLSDARAGKLAIVRRLLTEPSELERNRGPVPQLHALSEDQLQTVRHPMARAHEQLLARVQSIAAKTQRPDFSTLKLYCERITDKGSMVSHVVDEAATMLGVGHVDVYVSRGHDDVGLRAFDNQTPVLLVGGQHLDSDSRYHMYASELLFAVAGELSHLRFEHARVGPKDVARGLFDKSKQGLDIVLSLLPIVAGLKLADRLTMATARLSLPRVGKLMAAAKDLSKVLDAGQPKQPRSDLAQANETLIEAHRFSQLSADRAGLLACGQLDTALFSLLLSRTDYVRVSTRLGQQGLLAAVAEQRTTNPRAFDDLLMRIGFLVGFYVSEEFDLLRAVVSPP